MQIGSVVNCQFIQSSRPFASSFPLSSVLAANSAHRSRLAQQLQALAQRRIPARAVQLRQVLALQPHQGTIPYQIIRNRLLELRRTQPPASAHLTVELLDLLRIIGMLQPQMGNIAGPAVLAVGVVFEIVHPGTIEVRRPALPLRKSIQRRPRIPAYPVDSAQPRPDRVQVNVVDKVQPNAAQAPPEAT